MACEWVFRGVDTVVYGVGGRSFTMMNRREDVDCL